MGQLNSKEGGVPLKQTERNLVRFGTFNSTGAASEQAAVLGQLCCVPVSSLPLDSVCCFLIISVSLRSDSLCWPLLALGVERECEMDRSRPSGDAVARIGQRTLPPVP